MYPRRVSLLQCNILVDTVRDGGCLIGVSASRCLASCQLMETKKKWLGTTHTFTRLAAAARTVSWNQRVRGAFCIKLQNFQKLVSWEKEWLFGLQIYSSVWCHQKTLSKATIAYISYMYDHIINDHKPFYEIVPPLKALWRPCGSDGEKCRGSWAGANWLAATTTTIPKCHYCSAGRSSFSAPKGTGTIFQFAFEKLP